MLLVVLDGGGYQGIHQRLPDLFLNKNTNQALSSLLNLVPVPHHPWSHVY